VIERDISFFGETFGLSYIDPICGSVGGALEAILIDEGFEQVDGVAKIGGPVFSDLFDIEGEELRGKVRDFDVGQD
jgi:hypothetical protein